MASGPCPRPRRGQGNDSTGDGTGDQAGDPGGGEADDGCGDSDDETGVEEDVAVVVAEFPVASRMGDKESNEQVDGSDHCGYADHKG